MAAVPISIRGRMPDASLVDDIATMLDELYADVDAVANAESLHQLLDDVHEDTVEADPVRGDLIIAQTIGSTTDIAWQRKALGASGTYLKSDGTDVVYGQIQETDIVDGSVLARVGGNETITGTWTFNEDISLQAGNYLKLSAGTRIASASGTDVIIGDNAANNNSTISFYTTFSRRLRITNAAIQAETNIPFRALSNSASAPAYSDSTDTNTGMYFGANNDTILFSCGGTLRITFSTTQIVSTVTVNGPTGSNTAPTYSHSTDTNTGIYFDNADSLLITTGGTLRWTINTNQVINTLGFVNSAVISPTALAAGATNDYAPTGFAAAYVLRLSGDAGGTSVLNSIAAPSAGREIVIINVSANQIGIAHDTGTTAANRFYTSTGAQVNLGQYDSARAWYDTTLSRWVLINAQL